MIDGVGCIDASAPPMAVHLLQRAHLLRGARFIMVSFRVWDVGLGVKD